MTGVLFVRAEKVCQWCGWKFEVSMSPFDSKRFREWAEMTRQHKDDCKVAYLTPGVKDGLTEAGLHFLEIDR